MIVAHIEMPICAADGSVLGRVSGRAEFVALPRIGEAVSFAWRPVAPVASEVALAPCASRVAALTHLLGEGEDKVYLLLEALEVASVDEASAHMALLSSLFGLVSEVGELAE